MGRKKSIPCGMDFGEKALLADQPGPAQGGDNCRDDNQLQDDGRDGVEKRLGDKNLEGKGAARQTHQDDLGDAPDDAAGDHRGDQAQIDALEVLLQAAIQQAADQAVGAHLKGHGDAGGEQRRHLKQQKAQRRQDQAHQRAVGPAADKSAQHDREVHGADHVADLRDLAGQKGQHQAQRKEEGGEHQLFGVGKCGWIVCHGKTSLIVVGKIQLVRRGNGAQHPAGVAGGDAVGGDIFGHHAACADDAVVPDGHAGQHGAAAAEPDVAADGDGAGKLGAGAPLFRVDGVAGGVKAAVWSDQHVLPKGDRRAVQDDAVVVDVKSASRVDVAAVVAPEIWLDVDFFVRLYQQRAQQRLLLVPLGGRGLVKGKAKLLAAPACLHQFRVACIVGQALNHLFSFCHGSSLLLYCLTARIISIIGRRISSFIPGMSHIS